MTWDPGQLERPVPSGGLRRRASEILYCESVGATDGASDRGRDDDDAGPYYTGTDLGFCLEGTEAPGDGDDCGEPFAGASGEGV